ncbi:DUF3427 domain-containing protein [Brevibacillus sp. RS1.1]|uniref:DUF3427 domain-containing protein n=1 Tax=Brevibacillus sp. RS1.1 TaxID=2738982 RepID=UPI00156B12D0|nr:DUF3427 domain-containing protein [Brevibacillus sp. RS1.1]NRR05927.1 DUF3427 domain-containing protein [Brevibacillus sp. RS1.1]
MSFLEGFFEELYRNNKEYPENNRVTPIHPRNYANALTQLMARRIGQALHDLASNENYMEMINLVQEIDQKINTNSQINLHSPLSTIHYRSDERVLPNIYPELFFTNPLLITNQGKGTNNFFKTLKTELNTADQADFMVSFIRWSGLQLLLRPFDELLKNGKKVRIITSAYMSITEPKALRRLMEMEHVEVRMFQSGKTSFHTKAYLFSRLSSLNTVLIGSSNLSKAAISSGYEWNVKLPDAPHTPIYQHAKQLFEDLWNDSRAIPLTEEFINQYEEIYQQTRSANIQPVSPQPYQMESEQSKLWKVADIHSSYSVTRYTRLNPNAMQIKALEALQETRVSGNTKGIVIAATGTGKTYLSAFDVHQSQASTLLFLAHRDELLENAKSTFARVFGSDDFMGKVTGTMKEWDKPFLFSTVQSLHREEVLTKFSPTYFDYVIVDEFHHAEADTYKKIIEYFKPKFLLGLTATPERMDGKDVLALCDQNVVYEIRLHQALVEELLAPFHYFGLFDNTVDYENVNTRNGQFVEESLVSALKTHERVDYVLEMIEKFGHDGGKRRALGFCASIEHARFMAEEFNLRGYSATFLTGEDDPTFRREMIRRLEEDQDSLEFIFTVNIFNEGIDIPSLNLVLFLRPTESPTIFIQQLGRGLRKWEGKEYVTILDFIGNYQKSFIIPLALAGQTNHRAFDRDSLRVAIQTEFANLPDGCFVDLEEITRQQILEKILSIRMDQNQMLANLYTEFKKELGRSPEIDDFLYSSVAPGLHFFIQKYGSWVETKKKFDDCNEWDEALLPNPLELEIVQRLEQMFPVKWPYELAVLSLAITHEEVGIPEVISFLGEKFGTTLDPLKHQGYICRSMQKLTEPYKKQKWSFGSLRNDTFVMDELIKSTWLQDCYKEYINNRVEYGLTEFRRTFQVQSYFHSNHQVQLYQNYTRNELMYLFQSPAKEGSWREGISKVNNHYLYFVTLDKDEDTEEHLNYHDYFIDQNHFHWQSANQTSHASERGKDYMHHRERGIHIHLFVRKFESMHGKTLPFMYVGELEYVKSHGDNPMNITWKLEQQLPYDIFLDFVR